MWLTLRNINTVFQWLKRKPGNFVLRHYYIFKMSHCDSHKYLSKPTFFCKIRLYTVWASNYGNASWHHSCFFCSLAHWLRSLLPALPLNASGFAAVRAKHPLKRGYQEKSAGSWNSGIRRDLRDQPVSKLGISRLHKGARSGPRSSVDIKIPKD